MAVHRPHIDQRARALLVHMLDACLRREKRSVDVDGHDLLPVGVGKVLDRIHDLDAGIGNEDVDCTERFHSLLDAGVDLLLIADVHGNGDGVVLAAQFLSGGLRGVYVKVGDGYASAGLNVAPGDRVTDAACRTRHQGDLAVELHGFFSLPGSR